jgi:hypothetical protein
MRTGQQTLATLTAMIMAGALTLSAQTPQTSPQNPPIAPAQQQAADISTQTITIVGCVKPEAAVPGQKPNVAERVGVSEDYILTNVKMSETSRVSGLGLSTMYEIEGVAGSELKKHINHQIELTGRVAADREVNDEAPDFHASSMKMVSATCPAEQ